MNDVLARFRKPAPFVTNDGDRYLKLARGEAVPLPYHLRWLVPKFNGTDVERWQDTTNASLAVIPVATYALARGWGASHRAALTAGVLVAGLPGITSINRAFPVLVDAPGLALTTVSAAALKRRSWGLLGPALSLLAGAAKETGPALATVFSANPLGLTGFAAPGWRWATTTAGDEDDPLMRRVLSAPLAVGREFHDGAFWRDWRRTVRPWGACVLALGARGRVAQATAVALALGYAQLFVATDTVRLYQQAGPMVAVAAGMALDELTDGRWLLMAAVVVAHHLADLGRGD